MSETKKEYVVCPDEMGNINISEDVIASIAVSAALEVEGVSGLVNTTSTSPSSRLNRKNAVRGVKLTVGDGSVIVDLHLMVKYGQAIPTVAQSVQEAVVNAIESMTDLKVCQVNVRVSGVGFGEETVAED